MKPKTNNDNCMFPGCEKSVTARGLCQNHYVSAHRLVRLGRTTWEKLEKKKKAIPLSFKNRVQEYFLGD